MSLSKSHHEKASGYGVRKIKAIIFDLDGVLVDSKEIHFNALNLALSEYDSRYVITKTEQEHIYEGMTTRSKLEVLTKKKGLPVSSYQDIWESKQKYTAKLFKECWQRSATNSLARHNKK